MYVTKQILWTIIFIFITSVVVTIHASNNTENTKHKEKIDYMMYIRILGLIINLIVLLCVFYCCGYYMWKKFIRTTPQHRQHHKRVIRKPHSVVSFTPDPQNKNDGVVEVHI